MKGLIIREPWVSLILSGQKAWEMRSKRTHPRGDVGLIRQGSKAVVGVARLVDCLPAVASLDEYAETEPLHRIPAAEQASAYARRWCIPWVLADVRQLTQPIGYQPRSGQQDWVTLDPAVVASITCALANMRT